MPISTLLFLVDQSESHSFTPHMFYCWFAYSSNVERGWSRCRGRQSHAKSRWNFSRVHNANRRQSSSSFSICWSTQFGGLGFIMNAMEHKTTSLIRESLSAAGINLLLHFLLWVCGWFLLLVHMTLFKKLLWSNCYNTIKNKNIWIFSYFLI